MNRPKQSGGVRSRIFLDSPLRNSSENFHIDQSASNLVTLLEFRLNQNLQANFNYRALPSTCVARLFTAGLRPLTTVRNSFVIAVKN